MTNAACFKQKHGLREASITVDGDALLPYCLTCRIGGALYLRQYAKDAGRGTLQVIASRFLAAAHLSDIYYNTEKCWVAVATDG